MEFKYFNVETTNMFPMANSSMGGQLLTEYNLIGKESAMTTPTIEYKAGLSFVHSESEFLVSSMNANVPYFPQSTTYTDSAIQISKGRAIINGYYVESLVDIVIDLTAINAELEPNERLTGELAIGLKTYFSDDPDVPAISGSILVEETISPTVSVYGGLQVVILPKDQAITPRTIIGDTNYGATQNMGSVTMDIVLATFNYNGSVSNLVPNPTRLQCIPAVRIEDMDSTLASSYVRKSGLQQNKFYTFAGKGTTDADTWCDSTDAIMVWDSAAPRLTSTAPTAIEKYAHFESTDTGVNLFVPHKQIDGMEDYLGNNQYFEPVRLPLPVADFATGSAGVVTSDYAKQVKYVANKINEVYTLPNMRQKAFIDELKSVEDLPPINQNTNTWYPGDYVLVAKDYTLESDLNDSQGLTPPSTMYVILAPIVVSVALPYTEDDNDTPDDTSDDTITPVPQPSGVELARKELDAKEYGETTNPLDRTDWWGDLSRFRGVIGTDYFTLAYTTYDGNDTPTTTDYYYKVLTNEGGKAYSEPIQLTGQYPFATTQMVGGFLDVDTAYTDNGYVYLDENGHLRLLDYALLRTGVLAYQLGEDFTMPTGLTYAEIQANLDEYINERVAFPNNNQLANATNPYVININIDLPQSDEPVVLKINGIDSRFNTAVCINLTGSADSNTSVVITNCQKVRILTTYSNNGPNIALGNSCLYYDANILSSLAAIVGLSLWYERYNESDLLLTVDGMTVSGYLVADTGLSVENIEYWEADALNDNHIQVALQSVTFADDGSICGCGILIRNNTTANVEMGKYMILDSFTLPNIPTILPYPENRLIQPICVTGEFMTAYVPMGGAGYICVDAKFTATTQHTVTSGTSTTVTPGELAVMIDAFDMASENPTNIHGWATTTYHLFNGAVNYT